MSSLPNLATHQRLVGFAMPEWMVAPIPRTFHPVSLPNTDALAVFMPGDVNAETANAAFQSLILTGIDIAKRAEDNVGKRGLNRKQYINLYWTTYLEGLNGNDILWAARSSPRYELTMELYRNLHDAESQLSQDIAEDVELFTRIDRYLALTIITDIADDLEKRKKKKKKLPPEQILTEILTEKGIDTKNLKTLLALAKKTPGYAAKKKMLLPLLKLM